MDVLSYALSKKYTDEKITEQKVKVAQVEKELNEYKAIMAVINIKQEAKQQVSGYGVVSLPKNAAEGQISVTAKGLTATNIINNGNFANGTSGWLGTNATISVSNNIMQVVPDGSATIGWLVQNTSYPIFPSRKYFIKAKLRVTNNDCVRMCALIRSTEGSGDSIYTITAPVANQWYSLAIILDSQATHAGNFRLLFNHNYADAATANGKIMEVQEVMVIDLIAHGLESKTVEELTKMFANYFEGTKSTLCAGRFRAVGKNLFNKSRASKGFSLNPNNGSQQPVNHPAFCSDFIRVNSNEQYYISGLLNKGYSFVAYYDKDKRFTRRNSATYRSQMLISDLQDNEKYIRITVYDNANAPATWEDINNVLNNLQVEKGSVATAYETYRESNAYVIAKNEQGNVLELRSLPNGIKDELSVVEGKYTKNVSDPVSVSGTMFASLDTTTYVNVDVVKTTAFSDAKAGTTAKDGMTRLYNKNGVELTEVAQTDIDNTASAGKYYWHTDKTLWLIVAKGAYADISAARTALGTMTLNYQLATPVEIPVQVSGTLVGYSSGTVYWEPMVADAGVYAGKMDILNTSLPIKRIEKLSKVDYATGVEYELDPAQAVISADKLSFTHPSLSNGDIVFFVYEYNNETTIPEMAVQYYDSRYVVKDSATGKFYKWKIVVNNGTPSIQLEEV